MSKWIIEKQDNEFRIFNGKDLVTIVYESTLDSNPNATLIAAAPELLSSLIDIWAAVENGTVDRDFFKLREQYRNIINKAIG